MSQILHVQGISGGHSSPTSLAASGDIAMALLLSGYARTCLWYDSWTACLLSTLVAPVC